MRGRVPGSGPFGAFPEVSRNEVLVRIAARLTHYLSGSVSLSFRGLRGVAGVTESTTGTTVPAAMPDSAVYCTGGTKQLPPGPVP